VTAAFGLGPANLALLGLAGAAGAICRYLVYATVAVAERGAFPWATLLVNCGGSLLFGLTVALADEAGLLSPRARVVVLAGFLGALTTFSTFAFENAELLRLGHLGRALLNVLAQNLGAVFCVFAGHALGRGLAG
jgi:CrcB protein